MVSTLDCFKTIVPISNPSGGEVEIRQYIEQQLHQLGFTNTVVDSAGNLLAYIPGDANKETLLLSAHMDSVPPCEGIVPVEDTKEGRVIVRSEGNTILGADDKSGIATILTVIQRLTQEGVQSNHPLELLFSTEEEIGLLGLKAFDVSQCQSTMGYVLDGEGSVGDLFCAGLSQYHLIFTVQGRTAHAGICPEEGIHAVQVAADLCAQLPTGRLSDDTTMNIGTIMGGEAINIVPDQVTFAAELRSHDGERIEALLRKIEMTCQSVQAAHAGSVIQCEPLLRYERFVVPEEAHVVEKAKKACEQLGIQASVKRMHIGSDAHILNQINIPTIVLGMGFHYSHSLGEFIYVDELEQVTEQLWRIILG